MAASLRSIRFHLEVKMVRTSPNLPPYALTWIIDIRMEDMAVPHPKNQRVIRQEKSGEL